VGHQSEHCPGGGALCDFGGLWIFGLFGRHAGRRLEQLSGGERGGRRGEDSSGFDHGFHLSGECKGFQRGLEKRRKAVPPSFFLNNHQ